MNYQEIKQILNNIREENKSIDLYTKEYNRMNDLLTIEHRKNKPNKDRITALENHLKNIKDFLIKDLDNRTLIVQSLFTVDEPYSSIILERYFERKSFQEIEVKYYYPETTIKKYIERGIKKMEVKINEINGSK